MKKSLKCLTATTLALVYTLAPMSLLAAEAKKEGEKKTVEGTGLCAKCSLKETDSCQNAIQVEKDGKKVTYYLAKNDLSKKFHEKICKHPEKVRATGTVQEVNGKLELTPSELEVVNSK